jgi:ribosomal protein S18 acetylase RimI-like enzyme
MTFDIRLLTRANASLLNYVAPDVFDNPIVPASLEAFLADPRHLMVLAVDGESVVGIASAFEYVHPDKPPQMFINEVGVAPTHQRRGIGRRLVDATLDEARRRGCSAAWVATDGENEPAQALYASVPGGAEPQRSLIYEWKLKP